MKIKKFSVLPVKKNVCMHIPWQPKWVYPVHWYVSFFLFLVGIFANTECKFKSDKNSTTWLKSLHLAETTQERAIWSNEFLQKKTKMSGKKSSFSHSTWADDTISKSTFKRQTCWCWVVGWMSWWKKWGTSCPMEHCLRVQRIIFWFNALTVQDTFQKWTLQRCFKEQLTWRQIQEAWILETLDSRRTSGRL